MDSDLRDSLELKFELFLIQKLLYKIYVMKRIIKKLSHIFKKKTKSMYIKHNRKNKSDSSVSNENYVDHFRTISRLRLTYD